MSSSKIFPFQPKLDANECHFCLPQLRAVIHLTLSDNAHCSRAGFFCKECALIKLIGLLHYCSQIWRAEMAFMKNFGSRHCLTKCALENKLLNQNCGSWYHFSLRRSCLIHWYELLHPHIVGSIPFRFFSGPPCIFWLNSVHWLEHNVRIWDQVILRYCLLFISLLLPVMESIDIVNRPVLALEYKIFALMFSTTHPTPDCQITWMKPNMKFNQFRASPYYTWVEIKCVLL